MDLLKLFALLVAVASARISAEGPKKKIRIHLPQKVKHIHHHKKIYITNHPASSQYAPAYMPSAESAMAVPSVAVGGLLPINPVDMYDEPAPRAPSASKLLPLYHARDHYGPGPGEWEDQEYDLSPPPEPVDAPYGPTGFSGPSAVAASLTKYPPKKVKIVKLNEPPRKKAVRKGKPKRVPPRGIKPQLDEEIPVTTFHEQFYSDLDGSATLRKVKKPQRIEKIIDGDTEHIHTYSEEHVHKLVYNDGRSRLIGVDPVGGMSALSASHQIFPVKNSLLALSPEALTGFASIGSMGTPSHLEYTAYNPRDVTHDHVFHDHGEIPSDVDVSKENLPYPPRVSYNSQGIRIGGLGSGTKGHKSKYALQSYTKPTRPSVTNDYSYYENMYSPYARPRVQRPTNPSSLYAPTTEAALNEYRSIPSFKLRDKANINSLNVPTLNFGAKQVPEYRSQRASDPPYAVSSTIVHDYKPKNYVNPTPGILGYSPSKFKDPLQNFKDNSYTSNFDFDSYASATSSLYTDDKFNPSAYLGKKGKKKSISTQNIRIGGLDHQTTVDHLGDAGLSTFLNDGLPTALDFGESKQIETITSTPYTIRESSPAHPYYSAMAAKALQGADQMQAAESSNNVQYVEAPTTEFGPMTTTNEHYEQENLEQVATEVTESAETTVDTRHKHTIKDSKSNPSSLKDTKQRSSGHIKDYKGADRPVASHHIVPHHRVRHSQPHGAESPHDNNGSRKYGDKI